jgi:hypothetical protein
MKASAFIAASAAVILFLGFLHLLYTFRGPKVQPRDPDLTARMMTVSPVISPETTMWRLWVGFNATHVHKSSISACILLREAGRVQKHQRRFGAMTQDLRELAEWLGQFGVTQVALIGERVKSGLANARAKGKVLGRPPLRKLKGCEVAEIRRQRAHG